MKYRCQSCGEPKDLPPDPFRITLCVKCHDKITGKFDACTGIWKDKDEPKPKKIWGP